MPSWIKIPWNKCWLGRRSIKLQIPHGDIPVFCFTDAGTVSVGATTWFWIKHCSGCFRNKTGCHKSISNHTSCDLKSSTSLTSTWPLEAITKTPQRSQDETDKMPTRCELSWWPPTAATMCDCVQGSCMRRPAHDWTDESNHALHHMLLNVLAFALTQHYTRPNNYGKPFARRTTLAVRTTSLSTGNKKYQNKTDHTTTPRKITATACATNLCDAQDVRAPTARGHW